LTVGLGTGFHAFRHAYDALRAQVGTDDPKKVKEVQMQLLRQGDERTNDRYGKSAQPLRQHARQAHINVSDLVIGEAVSTYADRKGDQIWTKLQGQPFGILLMYMERENIANSGTSFRRLNLREIRRFSQRGS